MREKEERRAKPGRGYKLSSLEVRLIRDMLKQGWSQRATAVVFGVNHTTIGDIAAGKTWKFVR